MSRKSSITVVNCASRRTDVGAGSFKRRAPYLARIILGLNASFVVGVELYAAHLPTLLNASHKGVRVRDRYAVAVAAGGRVILYRRGRWSTTRSKWRKAMGANGSKITAADTFYRGRWRMTVFANHFSWETNAKGQRKRLREVRALRAWVRWWKAKTRGKWTPYILAGDFNSQAGEQSRRDVVGRDLAKVGYHNLGKQAGLRTGRGFLNVINVYGPKYVRGYAGRTIYTRGSDHAVLFIKFTW